MRNRSLLLLAVCAAAPLSAQSVRRAKAPITVGPLVHVSKAYAKQPHYETLSAGDPDHPGRMIACTTLHPVDTQRWMIWQYCYVTFDGGKNWEPSFKSEIDWGNQDPAVIYGRGDTVYVASLTMVSPKKAPDPDPEKADPNSSKTEIFRSTDGGRTWGKVSEFQFIDREFLNVDRTNGKYGGRVYNIAQGGVRGISGVSGPSAIQVMRSLDGGKTWLGPATGSYPVGAVIFGVGTGAVLSDGTYLASFALAKAGRSQSLESDRNVGPNAEMLAVRSTTGGETFTTPKVADVKLDRSRSEGAIVSQLYADPGSAAFKDRVYVVWPGVVDERVQVQVAYSSDKGKTWSTPVVVNDDRNPADGSKGPDHILPSIGVNKDGVVLVTWYDRRDAKDNLGWQLRASASLDGGDTWSASVPVTNAVNSYAGNTPVHLGASGSSNSSQSKIHIGVNMGSFFGSGGHTTGMAVDADGTFHPTWHSNQTGVMQLYSASIKVEGVGTKSGSAELAALEDISKSVELQMLPNAKIDRGNGTVTITGRLKNISQNDTIEGPIKVRVLTLESALGVPEILNADNGEKGTGAVWDFSSTLSGPLTTWQLAAPKTLTFKLSDIRPFGFGKELKTGMINIDAKVYGKIRKAKPTTDEKKE
jgi:hypothetical protein